MTINAQLDEMIKKTIVGFPDSYFPIRVVYVDTETRNIEATDSFTKDEEFVVRSWLQFGRAMAISVEFASGGKITMEPNGDFALE